MFKPRQLMTELASKSGGAHAVSRHLQPTATTANPNEHRNARRLFRSRAGCHVPATKLPPHLATAAHDSGGAPVTQTGLAHDGFGVCLARIDCGWAAAHGGERLRA